MSSSPEHTPNLLETWKDNSVRLRFSYSGSGISFEAEGTITDLDPYNVKFSGAGWKSRVKLEHAQTFFDQAGQVEILLTSGDRVRLRAVG